MINKKLFLLIFVSIFLIGIVSADTLQEFYDTGQDNNDNVYDLFQNAQTFRINSTGQNDSYNIHKVSLFMKITGSPTDDLQVQITRLNANASTQFTNNRTLSFGRSSVGNFTTSYAWVNISMTNFTVTKGEYYAIVVNVSGAGSDGSNNYNWGIDIGGTYADGTGQDTDSTGVTWTSQGWDNLFRIYNNTVPGGGPIITTLNSPSNAVAIATQYIFFNALYTGGVPVQNGTLSIWYTNSSLFQRIINLTSGITNSTTWNLTGFSSGETYLWNVQYCGVGVGNCSFASSNYSFSYGILNNSYTYNVSTFETASERFVANITSVSAIISANLNYKGTVYSGNVSSLGGNDYQLLRTIDIPAGNVTNNWNWDVTLANGQMLSFGTLTQQVNLTNFTICGGAINTAYINITFKNETTLLESVRAIVTSTWTYWLGSGTANKTLTYNSAVEMASYAFCLQPSHLNLAVIPNVAYSNSYSTQRTYNPAGLSLTNASTNVTLYLLPNILGQVVSFQVKTVSGSVISGATINITRVGFGLIESKTTDDSGVASFFLNPQASYVITTFKQGYDLRVDTITPSQTSYTITLGAQASGNQTYDFSQGINYKIYPSGNILLNNTNYTFAFVISSTFWGLTSYGFNLTDANGNILGTASGSSVTGSNVSTVFNTGNYSFVKINYYWYIGGNLTTGSHAWIIASDAGSGFSLSNFVTHLKQYLNSSSDSDGLFGLTINTSTGNFSLAILIFLTIFCFAGVMSFKYGISAPSAIAFIIFSGVLLFDVALGLMPRIIGIPHFVTLFMGIIMVALFLREAT